MCELMSKIRLVVLRFKSISTAIDGLLNLMTACALMKLICIYRLVLKKLICNAFSSLILDNYVETVFLFIL